MSRVIAPDLAARQLAHIYAQAHQQLTQQIATAVERGNLGTEAQRRRQLQVVRLVLKGLLRKSGPLEVLAMGQAYGSAAAAVDLTAGLNGRGFSFAGVHQRAVLAGTEALHGRLDEAVGNVGRYVEDVFRKVQVEHATVGLAAADRRRDVSRRMAADLRARGIGAFTDKAGRQWSLESYTKMTVRTNTREMVSVGVTNRLRETPGARIQVSSHATKTPVCQQYEGKTYPVDDVPALAPFHPNCWHVMFPATANLDQFEQALAEGADVISPQLYDLAEEAGYPVSRRLVKQAAPRATLPEPPGPQPDVAQLLDGPDPKPPFGEAAAPATDAATYERLAAQRTAYLIDGDPGPEAGALDAWERHIASESRRMTRDLNRALGPDLVKFIDRDWGRKMGVRRQLLEGKLTIEDVEDMAVTEWQRLEARRLERDRRKDRVELRERAIPCFVCGRFKRRPADVCDYCGDDPVTVGGDAESFNRNYGYSS